MEKLQVKLLKEEATIPTRNHDTDAGLDIHSAEDVILNPQQKKVISTGVAVDIPKGYVGLLTGRSGVSSKTDLVVTLGIIDSGYNGDLGINIKNDWQDGYGKGKRSSKSGLYDVKGNPLNNEQDTTVFKDGMYHIKQGDKLAQLLIVPIETPELEIVDEFKTVSERGEKGWGSSGV